VNEIFLRVGVLHAMAPDVLNSRLVGTTHFAVIAVFAILISYFNVRYWRRPIFAPPSALPARR
jgi:hypothetical protein